MMTRKRTRLRERSSTPAPSAETNLNSKADATFVKAADGQNAIEGAIPQSNFFL